MKLRGILISALLACVPVIPVTAAENAAEAAKKPTVAPQPRRLTDGHPNWTGFWVPLNGMLEHDIGLGGSDASRGPPGAPPGGPPPGGPPPGAAPSGAAPPPGGAAPPGGPQRPVIRAPFSNYPTPIKSPYKEKLEKYLADEKQGKVQDPIALCFPPGMPRQIGAIYGMELLQTPGQIAITGEFQAAIRRIWLDRKTHPPEDELDPTYSGDSVGHWEGDKLVVDTVGIREDVPLNYGGLPHSAKLRVREVYSETSPGILQIEITIDDPDVFSAPWKETATFRYRPDLRLREYVCLENNRNVGAGGEAKF